MGKDLPKGRTSDLKAQIHRQFERALGWGIAGAVFAALGVPGLGSLASRGLATLAKQETSPFDPLTWLSAGCSLVGVCLGVVSLVYYRQFRAYDAAFKQRREELSR